MKSGCNNISILALVSPLKVYFGPDLLFLSMQPNKVVNLLSNTIIKPKPLIRQNTLQMRNNADTLVNRSMALKSMPGYISILPGY